MDDFFNNLDPKIFDSIHSDEASRSDLDSVFNFVDENSAQIFDKDPKLGDFSESVTPVPQNHESVPNFSAVNEFFEFRLYDVTHMNRIWDEALSLVHRKSARASNSNYKLDLALAKPVHDQLELWEM